MKTYEEMAKSALERIEQHKTEAKQHKKTVIKIAVPGATLCLAAIFGITVWQTGLLKKPTAVQPVTGTPAAENTAENTVFPGEDTAASETAPAWEAPVSREENIAPVTDIQAPTDEVSASAQTTAAHTEESTSAQGTEGKKGDDVDTSAAALLRLGDKLTVSGALYYAISENPEGTFRVTAYYRPATAEITDYTYEGKTLSEWAIASEDSRFTLQKMHELLKQGEELKYGSALYETGMPDGIKWDKNFYEERIKYFGPLIDKYIVNGEFLHEQLSKDIAEYDSETAVDKYARAYNSYLEKIMPSVVQKLTQNGISCERAAYSVNGVTFTVTAQQLENIPLDDLEDWSFDLADNGQKGDAVYPATDASGFTVTN